MRLTGSTQEVGDIHAPKTALGGSGEHVNRSQLIEHALTFACARRVGLVKMRRAAPNLAAGARCQSSPPELGARARARSLFAVQQSGLLVLDEQCAAAYEIIVSRHPVHHVL